MPYVTKHSASGKVPVKSTRGTQKMWTERKTMADQQTRARHAHAAAAARPGNRR